MADTNIYHQEYNFLASTVIGLAGAGENWFETTNPVRIMHYMKFQ
jgi:hypothetical protein